GAANNFLLALVQGRAALGLALTDISTGEFWVGEGGPELLDAALVRRPAEILLPSPLREEQSLCDRLAARGAVLTFCDPATFALRPGVETLRAHFKVATLDALGVAGMTVGLQAAAGALGYLRDTHGQALGHLTRLQRLLATESMTIDASAVETLELTTALFGALNRTRTPMGARLLRQWLLRPLLDPAAIRQRQDAVEALVGAPAARDGLRGRLERGRVDEPPLVRREGGLSRPSWSDALRELVAGAREARAWIGELESRERARTGIASLRVRYNRVFGYGIEVSHAQ